jgi:hypothetical protein
MGYSTNRQQNQKQRELGSCSNCKKGMPEKQLTMTKTGWSCNKCYNPQSPDEV